VGGVTTVTVPTTVTLPGVGTTVTAPCSPDTTSATSAPEVTGIQRNVPPYTYLQCTNNGGASLALSESPTTSTSLTPASCARTCSEFIYFGVTRGNTCYCGNTLNPRSNNPNDNACNIPCTGNTRQLCGGQAHIQLYRR
jgi:hypothetical protein